MLTYLLAIVVAVGSFALYMAAFFFPEIHRKYDLIWSGVGMFYALVLWVCGGRITGGVLMGQIASVSLIGWFTWQALELRWEQTPLSQRTQVPEAEDSFGNVVQSQSQKLWEYLQTEEFKSRLPKWWQQGIDRVFTWSASTKDMSNAWISTTFKPQPYSMPDTPDADAVSDQAEKKNPSDSTWENVE